MDDDPDVPGHPTAPELAEQSPLVERVDEPIDLGRRAGDEELAERSDHRACPSTSRGGPASPGRLRAPGGLGGRSASRGGPASPGRLRAPGGLGGPSRPPIITAQIAASAGPDAVSSCLK